MTTKFTTTIKALIAIIISLSALSLSASAQVAKTKSRVAVVANETKTKIWVSDFPKMTNVVIMDADNNLLSMTTTNEYGAAFICLPAGIATNVVVKTLDGTVVASNKAGIKTTQHEESVASNDEDESTIA